MDINSL